MKKISFLLSIILAISSCKQDNQFSLTIVSNLNTKDTIVFREFITDKVIAEFLLDSNVNNYTIPIEYPTAGVLECTAAEENYLFSLTSGKRCSVLISKDGKISSDNICDSLLNYLHTSNNEFINGVSNYIFSTVDLDSVVQIFEDFRIERENVIINHFNELTNEEVNLLQFHNSARIYSFLFYFGRIAKQLDLNSHYYDFSENIDQNNTWIKTLPDILLYKYEIEFYKLNGSINSVESFIEYISTETQEDDLSDFLVSRYLNMVLEMPSNWKLHEFMINPEVLRDILDQEKDNPYFEIIKKSSDSYFKSQKGEIAYNFKAVDKYGKEVQLDDFKGKVVLIDSWATWCGPCLNHRPAILKLAEKYKDNPSVVVLMISVDKNKTNWLNYLNKEDSDNYGMDLNIPNGMNTEFGNSFNIKTIPKYILIDKNGMIYNSDIPEPSIMLEQMIEKLIH